MTDPADGSTQPGDVVSHYRIIERLGSGGMGEVFLVEDLKLQRLAALKLIAPDLTRDESRRQRFLQEARLAAAIDHDITRTNVVTSGFLLRGKPVARGQLMTGRWLAMNVSGSKVRLKGVPTREPLRVIVNLPSRSARSCLAVSWNAYVSAPPRSMSTSRLRGSALPWALEVPLPAPFR